MASIDQLDPRTEKLPFGVEKVNDLLDECIVYYSGTITNSAGDPEFGYKLVTFLLENGAQVPSAHVAARTPEERLHTFFQMSGEGMDADGNDVTTNEMVARIDLGWVDAATHLVVCADDPSTGVGIEIGCALSKPARGLNPTPILCLIREGSRNPEIERVAAYSKGFWPEGKLIVRTYLNADEAKRIVTDFLTSPVSQADPEI